MSLNTSLLQGIKIRSLRLSFHGNSINTQVSQIAAFPFTSMLNQVLRKSFITLDGTQAFAAHLPGTPAVFN